MVNKKASIRFIQGKVPGRVVQGLMIGQTTGGHTLEILRKHVNCKSCVHQISKCDCVWLECIVVDWWCRGSKGQAKIEGYMSVSDEEAHQREEEIFARSLQCTWSHFLGSLLGQCVEPSGICQKTLILTLNIERTWAPWWGMSRWYLSWHHLGWISRLLYCFKINIHVHHCLQKKS